MKELLRDAENPFLSPMLKSSVENIEQFVSETIDRFTSRLPEASYQPTIDSLKSNFDSFRNAVQKAQIGNQKSATEELKSLKAEIMLWSKHFYALLQTKFGVNKEKLFSWFPYGKTEVHRAKRGDVVIILERWNRQLRDSGNLLDASVQQQVESFIQRWQTLSYGQSDEKREVTEGRKLVDVETTKMALDLLKLYLRLRLDNISNPKDAIAMYFNVSSLKRRRKNKSESTNEF
jgi:hypothetical protein